MVIDNLINLLKLGDFESQNTRVSLVDSDLNYVYLSTSLFGRSNVKMGSSVLEFHKDKFDEENFSILKGITKEVLSGREVNTTVVGNSPEDDSKIKWNIHSSPIYDENGKIYILSHMAPENIKLSQKSTNHFIRTIVEHSNDIITVFDEDYNYAYLSRVDKEWEHMNFIGVNIDKIMDGENLRKWYKRSEKAKKNPGEVFTNITYIVDPSGNERIFEASMEYQSVDGLGSYYLERVVDVTEREKTTQEIERQKMVIQKMTKWTALGQMAGSVAHEVNNPLAIIYLQVQSIERRFDDLSKEEILEKLTMISEQKERISSIVSSLNMYSKEKTDIRSNIALSSIVHDTIALFRTQMVDNELRVTFSNDTANDTVCVNHSEIIQVIINLLNNAYDAISDMEKPWIELALSEDAAEIILDVTDSGNGVNEEDQDRIFERFFTTKSIDKGTGLGLNISQEIMINHKGTLYYDKLSKNTTFTMTLPKVESN